MFSTKDHDCYRKHPIIDVQLSHATAVFLSVSE